MRRESKKALVQLEEEEEASFEKLSISSRVNLSLSCSVLDPVSHDELAHVDAPPILVLSGDVRLEGVLSLVDGLATGTKVADIGGKVQVLQVNENAIVLKDLAAEVAEPAARGREGVGLDHTISPSSSSLVFLIRTGKSDIAV